MEQKNQGDKVIRFGNMFELRNVTAGDVLKVGGAAALTGFASWCLLTKSGRSFVSKSIKKLSEIKDRKIDRPWKGYKRPPKLQKPENIDPPVDEQLIGLQLCAGKTIFLFAPTDMGKTTLAIQLACEMMYEKESNIFPGSIIRKPKKLIYYDEEYEGESFQKDEYIEQFTEKNDGSFMLCTGSHGGIDEMLDGIYEDVNLKEHEGQDVVIFVDNIAAVCSGTYGRRTPNGEGYFMQSLKSLKNYLKDVKGIRLTIVLIAHTNKDMADESKKYKPLTNANLQGTSQQVIFANQIIAMGATRISPDHMRIKADKNKKAKKDGCVWVVERTDSITFKFVGYELEEDTISVAGATVLRMEYMANDCDDQQNSIEPNITKKPQQGAKCMMSKEEYDFIVKLREEERMSFKQISIAHAKFFKYEKPLSDQTISNKYNEAKSKIKTAD